MDNDEFEIPPYLKKIFEQELLEAEGNGSYSNLHELGLFKWHLNETEALHKQMYDAELKYIQEQDRANVDTINDSGMIPVDYFLKRARYADVVYLTSLLETILDRQCQRLTMALPAVNISFSLDELSGNKWVKRRKYLERYGNFDHPKSLWKPVNRLITLRNSIVHDNGDVDALSKNDRDSLTKCPGLSLNRIEISIDRLYVDTVVAVLEKLTQYYDKHVSEVVQRSKRPQSI